SHRHGPEATIELSARADECLGTLIEQAGGIDPFLAEHAVILVADHAQTDVDRGLPLTDILAADWSVLQPSEMKPELAQLAVSPTGRAAHVYLLPGEGERADPRAVGERLAEIEGVDLVCRLLDAEGAPLYRPEPGMPPSGDEWAVVERAAEWLRFRPGTDVADLRGGRWEIEGELSALEARIE